MLEILIDQKYEWQYTRSDLSECWYVGSERTVDGILSFIEQAWPGGLDELKRQLHDSYGNFAFICRRGDWIIAAADKIRSYPIFYYQESERFQISNCAIVLNTAWNLESVDEISLIEFRMAGYVTGRETLYRHLYQVQAGEVVIWNEGSRTLERERYYLFFSKSVREEGERDLIEELDEVTNKVFLRSIEGAKGAPIWVPLSGGLDSRLVLCKLKQLGYDDLNAFSYGPRSNYEAKVAKHVAEKIGVPWRFVESERKRMREFFWSDERREYWEFASGLHVVPNLHWIDSTKYLMDSGLIPSNAVFINGQSGDFIAGNHIPVLSDMQFDRELLCDKIIEKHYSLLQDHLVRGDFKEIIKQKILRLLVPVVESDICNHEIFAKLYELWEWQERQCKRVINGQRTYDYYRFSWELPLWADEYLFYWQSVPARFKLKRYLFRQYVEQMDFYELFRKFKPYLSRWPREFVAIEYLGKAIKLILGGNVSQKYYKYLDYYSQYSSLYAPFDYGEFLRVCQNIKGPLPLFGKVWEDDNLSVMRVS